MKDDELRLENLVIVSGVEIRNRGYLLLEDLRNILRWKSGNRVTHYADQNDDDFIKEICKTSFLAYNEKLRIEVLTLLKGVQYPAASAILHIVFPEKYPLIDFRALWSLWGIKQESIKHGFELWQKYMNECRLIIKKHKVDMRTLDRALWKYSDVNQGKE